MKGQRWDLAAAELRAPSHLHVEQSRDLTCEGRNGLEIGRNGVLRLVVDEGGGGSEEGGTVVGIARCVEDVRVPEEVDDMRGLALRRATSETRRRRSKLLFVTFERC